MKRNKIGLIIILQSSYGPSISFKKTRICVRLEFVLSFGYTKKRVPLISQTELLGKRIHLNLESHQILEEGLHHPVKVLASST